MHQRFVDPSEYFLPAQPVRCNQDNVFRTAGTGAEKRPRNENEQQPEQMMNAGDPRNHESMLTEPRMRGECPHTTVTNSSSLATFEKLD